MRYPNRLITNALDELDAFDEFLENDLDGAIDAAISRLSGIANRTTERRELLLHGTTLQRARQIQATGRFTAQDTYFALGYENRAVARVFAHRAAKRYPNEEGAALVIVSVPQLTIQRLRQQRLLIARQLQDPPQVRGRVEWVLSRGGVSTLNQDSEGLRIVRLTGGLRPRISSFDAFDGDTDEFDTGVGKFF